MRAHVFSDGVDPGPRDRTPATSDFYPQPRTARPRYLEVLPRTGLPRSFSEAGRGNRSSRIAAPEAPIGELLKKPWRRRRSLSQPLDLRSGSLRLGLAFQLSSRRDGPAEPGDGLLLAEPPRIRCGSRIPLALPPATRRSNAGAGRSTSRECLPCNQALRKRPLLLGPSPTRSGARPSLQPRFRPRRAGSITPRGSRTELLDPANALRVNPPSSGHGSADPEPERVERS